MAPDIFAKIGDIKGESLDGKHKDEIELLSWSWGVSRSAPFRLPAAAAAARRASRSLLHSQDRQGVAGAAERRARRTAPEGSDDHATEGRQGAAGLPRDQDERRDRHVRHDADESDGDQMETVTLAFAKVDLEYRPQKPDGSLDAGSTSSTTSRRTRKRSRTTELAWRRSRAEPRRGAVGRDRAAAGRAMGGRCGDLPDHPRSRARPCRRAALLRGARASAGAERRRRRADRAKPRARARSAPTGTATRDRPAGSASGWTRRSRPTSGRSPWMPDHANAHNNLGVGAASEGKAVDAEAAYRAAIRSTPSTRTPTTISAFC